MTPWVNNTLKELSYYVDSCGLNHLKHDIQRIEEKLHYTEFEIFRNSETDRILDSILELDSVEPMSDLIKDLCESFGIKYVANFLIDPKNAPIGKKIIANFPKEWMSEYFDNEYHLLDPIVKMAKTGKESFFWQDVDDLSEAESKIVHRAREFGIGPYGMTMTYCVFGKYRFAMNFVCDTKETHCSAEAKLNFFKYDLWKIATAFSKALLLLEERRAHSIRLNQESIAILRELIECGDIHALRKRSALLGPFRVTERRICETLDAKSLTHAAVLADRMGLLY